MNHSLEVLWYAVVNCILLCLSLFCQNLQCSCRLLMCRDNSWQDVGPGYANTSEGQLFVKKKETPGQYLLQCSLSQLLAYQQDANCILTLTVSLLTSYLKLATQSVGFLLISLD